MATKDEYGWVLEMEEIMWKHKSRVHWLKEGDDNTSFFHKMASCRRSINAIYRLKVDNTYLDKE